MKARILIITILTSGPAAGLMASKSVRNSKIGVRQESKA